MNKLKMEMEQRKGAASREAFMQRLSAAPRYSIRSQPVRGVPEGEEKSTGAKPDADATHAVDALPDEADANPDGTSVQPDAPAERPRGPCVAELLHAAPEHYRRDAGIAKE